MNTYSQTLYKVKKKSGSDEISQGQYRGKMSQLWSTWVHDAELRACSSTTNIVLRHTACTYNIYLFYWGHHLTPSMDAVLQLIRIWGKETCQLRTNLSPSHSFIPVGVETIGALDDGTDELGRRVAAVTGWRWTTKFLLQRLSVAIQRWSTACVLRVVTVGTDLSDSKLKAFVICESYYYSVCLLFYIICSIT